MSENSEGIDATVVTSVEFPVRLSYFRGITGEMVEDKKNGGKKRVWSSMILLPKKDEKTVSRIRGIITALVKEKWGDNKPKALKISFRDGDKEGRGGLPEGTEVGTEPYAGHYFFSARSDREVKVMDQNKQPIVDPSKIKSGDYAVVSVNFYAWDNTHGKGIAAGLGIVQLHHSGEPLGGNNAHSDKAFAPIDTGDSEGSAENTGSSDDVFDD